jgi:hypothetical protein
MTAPRWSWGLVGRLGGSKRGETERRRPERGTGHEDRCARRQLTPATGEQTGNGIGEVARDPDPQPVRTLAA